MWVLSASKGDLPLRIRRTITLPVSKIGIIKIHNNMAGADWLWLRNRELLSKFRKRTAKIARSNPMSMAPVSPRKILFCFPNTLK